MKTKRFLLLVLCMFIIGIFVTACGGGKTIPPSYPFFPVPTPSPTVSPTPIPTPTPTPTKYELELSQTEFTVNIGETDNITVTLNGEDITQIATYTVDQEAIATVEGGLITGLSVGVATVTVNAENAESEKTFTVNVIDPNLPTLEVSPIEVNLNIDEEATVTVKLNGEDVTNQVNYKSDEESIATVEKGLVKAGLKEGTAKIAVSLEGANSAVFTVNVTDNSEEVTLDNDVLEKLGYSIIEVEEGEGEGKILYSDLRKDGESITELEIPAIFTYEGKRYKITVIGNSLFSDFILLESITIPDTVKIIEYSAFHACKGLKSVTIGNGLISIENGAFDNCLLLNELIIQKDGDICIFPKAFINSSIEYITTNKGEIHIHESGFYTDPTSNITFIEARDISKTTEEIVIPDGVTQIPVNAFLNTNDSPYDSLKKVILPDSVKKIGSQAFYNCGYYDNERHLKLEVPDTVKTIGENAFKNINFTYSGSLVDEDNWGGHRE